MAVTLRNQQDPERSLSLTYQAWASLLDLAEAYGFRPLGAMMPGEMFWRSMQEPPYDPAGMASLSLSDDDGEDAFDYDPDELPVGWEDAMRLAEALEAAFLDYEPLRVPATFYLFETDIEHIRLRPAVGTINAAAEFCRLGPFQVLTRNGRTAAR
jgi:hypothetical protein